MVQLKKENFPAVNRKDLTPLIHAYAATPNHHTRDQLQRFIVAYCYQNRQRSGDFSGGKSGSLSFDIYPSEDHAKTAHERKSNTVQRQYYEHIIQEINETLHGHLRYLGKSESDFNWQGSTRFQMKFDSTRSVGLKPVREELNENVAELLTTCISDELRHNHPDLDISEHPNAIAFIDKNGETVIASQYMTNTLGTLSGFIAQCVDSLQKVNPSLVAEHLPHINLDSLRQKYAHFDMHPDREVSFVSEKTMQQSTSFIRHPLRYLRETFNRFLYDDQAVAVHDLNDLTSVYALFANQSSTHSDFDLYQPMLTRLVDEVSFSHAIADHDVNPGNFIVRSTGKDLTISRIDFGMANYHFTRGRIFGLSRRPFKNIFRDIDKESLHDFICRKKIGFGLGMFFTLVASKTSRHLSALKRIFLHPNNIEESSLVNHACTLNQKTHDALCLNDTQTRIIESFIKKIHHLPDASKLDILRDLKVIQLQSVRTAYLDFSTLKKSGTSLLKLIAMLSLTPLLMLFRFSYAPIVALSRFLPERFHLTNSIPLTTWTLIQATQLNHILANAQKGPLQLNYALIQSLATVLKNISLDNKHHLSVPMIQSLTSRAQDYSKFSGDASMEKYPHRTALRTVKKGPDTTHPHHASQSRKNRH